MAVAGHRVDENRAIDPGHPPGRELLGEIAEVIEKTHRYLLPFFALSSFVAPSFEA